MKQGFKGTSLANLCSWFGVTRQAYYQSKKRVHKNLCKEETLVTEVKNIRKLHRRMGGRKLLDKLNPFLNDHRLSIGRDAFFDLLRYNSLLVKPRKSYHKTTRSNH
jgi:putative transposase